MPLSERQSLASGKDAKSLWGKEGGYILFHPQTQATIGLVTPAGKKPLQLS